MEEKVVVLHGFDSETLIAIVRAVKATVSDPESIAFASTTSTNLEWQVGDLIEHVSEEHRAWRKRPLHP